MARSIVVLSSLLAVTIPVVSGHATLWHPGGWGFNVTMQTFPYDNRPLSPLMQYTFDQWWFHGHLDYPPHPDDFMELPAGGTFHGEVACDKGATSYYASDPGGNIQSGNDPCPGSPPTIYHTNGPDDLKGCALGIAYKSNVADVKPEDFAIFSVNQTCVWNRFTDFQIPAAMPPCPEGGCICGWFWIHSPDSGSAQMFMNGYQCKITGATSTTPVQTPQLARRCGADPDLGKMQADLSNCTDGAKQPLYWFQAEGNNMFEDQYHPPFYNDLYAFYDGAQNNIFGDGGADVPASSIATSAASSVVTAATGAVASNSGDGSTGTSTEISSGSTSSAVNAAASAVSSASASSSQMADSSSAIDATSSISPVAGTGDASSPAPSATTKASSGSADNAGNADPPALSSSSAVSSQAAESSAATDATSSASPVASTDGASSAEPSATAPSVPRKCKRRKSKSAKDNQKRENKIAPVHHRSLGRFVHDSTLH